MKNEPMVGQNHVLQIYRDKGIEISNSELYSALKSKYGYQMTDEEKHNVRAVQETLKEMGAIENVKHGYWKLNPKYS